jgi:hypothetical protein
MWFTNCIQSLNKASQEGGIGDWKIVLKRTELGGFAARAITAYQMYLASAFLAQRKYVPLRDGKDFADFLWTQLCGSQLPVCMQFLERYIEVAGDSTQLFRFCSDVARYITDQEAPLAEAGILATLDPYLVGMTNMVIAGAFNDRDAVSQIEAKLRDYFPANG